MELNVFLVMKYVLFVGSYSVVMDEQHYTTLLSQHCRPPAAKVWSQWH